MDMDIDIEQVLLDIKSPKRDELRNYVRGLEHENELMKKAARLTSDALDVIATWFLDGMPPAGLAEVAHAMSKLEGQLEILEGEVNGRAA